MNNRILTVLGAVLTAALLVSAGNGNLQLRVEDDPLGYLVIRTEQAFTNQVLPVPAANVKISGTINLDTKSDMMGRVSIPLESLPSDSSVLLNIAAADKSGKASLSYQLSAQDLAAKRQAAARAANERGKTLAKSNNYDDACPLFARSAALDPSFPNPHNNLGNCANRSGNPRTAIVQYMKYIELGPPPDEEYRVRREIVDIEKSLDPRLTIPPAAVDKLKQANSLAENLDFDAALKLANRLKNEYPWWNAPYYTAGVIETRLAYRDLTWIDAAIRDMQMYEDMSQDGRNLRRRYSPARDLQNMKDNLPSPEEMKVKEKMVQEVKQKRMESMQRNMSQNPRGRPR